MHLQPNSRYRFIVGSLYIPVLNKFIYFILTSTYWWPCSPFWTLSTKEKLVLVFLSIAISGSSGIHRPFLLIPDFITLRQTAFIFLNTPIKLMGFHWKNVFYREKRQSSKYGTLSRMTIVLIYLRSFFKKIIVIIIIKK